MSDLCPVVLQSQMVQKELVDELKERLTAAEEALATKQKKIDELKQEIFHKEKELETISVFQAQVSGHRHRALASSIGPQRSVVHMTASSWFLVQAEVYSSDFYAERAAREKLHEEKERLATQLEYVKKQNTQLQEEMDSLGRYGIKQKTIIAFISVESVVLEKRK